MSATPSYTVRRLRPRALWNVLALLAALLLWTVVLRESAAFLVVATLVALASLARRERHAALQLRADARGIELGRHSRRLGPVAVPWDSLGELVLAPEPLASGSTRVGLRLRAGAPLPLGAARPDRPGALPAALVRDVSGLDRARLEAVVAAFAPDVRVVEDPAALA